MKHIHFDSPIVALTLPLFISLTVPPIFERFRLPGLVGLLLVGVALGPDGLGWLDAETDTMELFSDIGKIYLMFTIGLELDLEQFRRTRNQSNTQQHHIEMAALLDRHESGAVVLLAVLQTPLHMDEPEASIVLEQVQQQL